jgi:hypothetical protein
MCKYGDFTFSDYSDYNLIFQGVAINCDTTFYQDTETNQFYPKEYIFSIKVKKVLKGNSPNVIIAKTIASTGANCTKDIKLNEDWIFFSLYTIDTAFIGGCSWTFPLQYFPEKDILKKINNWSKIKSASMSEKYFDMELEDTVYFKGNLYKGQLNDKWTLYTKNNIILEETNYKNGLEDSISLQYYDNSSKINVKYYYQQGIIKCYLTYSESGEITYGFRDRNFYIPTNVFTKSEIEYLIYKRE